MTANEVAGDISVLRSIRCLLFTTTCLSAASVEAQVLDQQRLLCQESFWDNRDWDWYVQMIPFFECPNREIQTTYYYRWELLTKHLTYGSPNSGYTFTEFIDRPFWSGIYGAISCPAGHQLYEARWLRDASIAEDFGRYWFSVPGAEPRRYSTWLADAIWATHQVHPNEAHVRELLPKLIRNFEEWEISHFVPEVGLFWQTGHDDGMEININSRQTHDRIRGAPGFRPTLNSYLYADALAIAKMAELTGDGPTAEKYRLKARRIKEQLQKRLWDPRREFFFHMAKNDETWEGHTIKAHTLTYQTGRFAGSPYGREEIGFVPWQFRLPDNEFLVAWRVLMDPKRFFAPFGPTTVERQDPLFEISKRCCVWSGNSWPYATTQTLKALANVLQFEKQKYVTTDDYNKLLEVYARTHRKNGIPYIAEACHPDTGSWDGHDSYNHSEHYFHSGFVDLIVTGLMGVVPRDDDVLELRPLLPTQWDYAAIDHLRYRGRNLTILWDKSGGRYGRGDGLSVLCDNVVIARSKECSNMTIRLPQVSTQRSRERWVNHAVNNDGRYYPRVFSNYTGPGGLLYKVVDGNYWYHQRPPNRWACEGSTTDSNWVEVDFGLSRQIKEITLYYLDDAEKVVPPERETIEARVNGKWVGIPVMHRTPPVATGHRANRLRVDVKADVLRVNLKHSKRGKCGLTEIEAWGPVDEKPYEVPDVRGNIAREATVRASSTYRNDRVEDLVDGIVRFGSHVRSRGTNDESPRKTDWIELEWPNKRRLASIELAIDDDLGGVRAPKTIAVEVASEGSWKPVVGMTAIPEKPTSGQINLIKFDPVETTRMRVILERQEGIRCGISEVLVFEGTP